MRNELFDQAKSFTEEALTSSFSSGLERQQAVKRAKMPYHLHLPTLQMQKETSCIPSKTCLMIFNVKKLSTIWTAFSVSHEAGSTYFTWNVFFSVICLSPSAFPLNVTTASYVPGSTPFDHVS